MKKMKSFLRHVAKVNIQMGSEEVRRIDYQVGLHRTSKAVFGSYIHEWALTKGKEKKPPKQVHYWKSDLSSEIKAEVDLYLQHLFQEANANNPLDNIPVLDYVGDGFVNPGVTVLFGGDHGDKHCPISCKISLSPPSIRKEKKQLSYQCPIAVFASVECSKDAYDLLNSTVMPRIKSQLTKLKESLIVTVYHRTNKTKVFRSYRVPLSIRAGTIGFIGSRTEGSDRVVLRMTFSHGTAATFGSIDIDDPVFLGVQFFELGAKVVINKFNELFIGNLAFLAMLIGMNHIAGDHCLMCTLKGSKFNCSATDMTLRTKKSVVECLEQYMLVMADSQKEKQASKLLWSQWCWSLGH
jgi:hypothetical protein